MFKKAKQIGAEDSTYTTRLRTLADSCGYPEMETEIRNHFIAAWTAQKMKFSIKDFFIKCDQTHLLRKSLMENFIFCAALSFK